MYEVKMVSLKFQKWILLSRSLNHNLPFAQAKQRVSKPYICWPIWDLWYVICGVIMPCKTYQLTLELLHMIFVQSTKNTNTQWTYTTECCWDRLEHKGNSQTYIYKSVPRDDNEQACTHCMCIYLTFATFATFLQRNSHFMLA